MMRAMELLDLKRRPTVVHLTDGPCAGRYTEVATWGQECWQRIGPPGGVGVETQMWARYDHNPMTLGEYVYSGVTITSDELQRALDGLMADGHTYGESRGA